MQPSFVRRCKKVFRLVLGTRAQSSFRGIPDIRSFQASSGCTLGRIPDRAQRLLRYRPDIVVQIYMGCKVRIRRGKHHLTVACLGTLTAGKIAILGTLVCFIPHVMAISLTCFQFETTLVPESTSIYYTLGSHINSTLLGDF